MPFTGTVEPEQLAILISVVDQHCMRVGIDQAGPERQAVAQLVMVLFRNGAATIEELKPHCCPLQQSGRRQSDTAC